MLEVKDLEVSYNNKRKVLNGVSFRVDESEIIAIIGPNGAGKTTMLKAIFGLLKVDNGIITYQGVEIQNRKPALNIREGISFVPQGRRIFPSLSVLENLELGGYIIQDKSRLKKRMDKTWELFPILGERKNQKAGFLSGGEQQILTLGMALMLEPKLLLLDEPSLGLSPRLVRKVLEKIREINYNTRTTILLVEQNAREALSIAQRAYVFKIGEIALSDTCENLIKSEEIKRIYLS